MAKRVVLVKKGMPAVGGNAAKVLHEYPNGDYLIETDGRTPESEESTPSFTGLRLATASSKQVDAVAGRFAESEAPEPILAYVEMIGPVDRVWISDLKALGLELIRYQPQNSYLCRGQQEAFEAAMKKAFVARVVPLATEFKPASMLQESGETDVWVVVYADQNGTEKALSRCRGIPGVEIESGYRPVPTSTGFIRIPARVDSEGQRRLLADSAVMAVETRTAPIAEDEIASLILAGEYDKTKIPKGSYLKWLQQHGVTGKGATIGIVDGGVDVTHDAYKDRIKDLGGATKSQHATMVAGHAAGRYLDEKDAKNFIYGLGTAPGAELLSQLNSKTAEDVCKETVRNAGPSGNVATIQNNSWGYPNTTEFIDYGSMEATWDSLVRNADPTSATPKPLTICFSAGNEGEGGLTRPKSAKNVIVTGNSENYRPTRAVRPNESDNIDEMYSGDSASSIGNCGDGRIRPHIVTPGQWTASANYGITSASSSPRYVSDKIVWGGGTSGASPKTAGACAILTEWWRNHNAGATPSPALLRALLVNGAEDMNFKGRVPNKYQGWGRLNLNNVLDESVHKTYIDQSVIFKDRSQTASWKVRVSDPSKPVRITLTWTDPPGATSSGTPDIPAIVNRLNLRVMAAGQTYIGNNFADGHSKPGSYDKEGLDNTQNVFLPFCPSEETIEVCVDALEITMNCFTNKVDDPQQDFALVVWNGYLDQAECPSDVFLVIDSASDSTPPDSRDDHWDSSAADADTKAADAGYWSDLSGGTAGSSGSSGSTDVDTSGADAGSPGSWFSRWWGEESSTHAEETPESEESRTTAFKSALANGVAFFRSRSDHSVRAESEDSGGGAEGARFELYEEKLGTALKKVTDSWLRKGAARIDGYQPFQKERPIAVVVVGAGTRVVPNDIESLRALSFQGDLYLLSKDAGILNFLAQRVYRVKGIHFRSISAHVDTAFAVRDCLAEASGAMRIVADEQKKQNGTSWRGLFRFAVSQLDQRLAIHIDFSSSEGQRKMSLKTPDGSVFEIRPGLARAGVTAEFTTSSVFVCLDSKKVNGAWAGTWEFEVNAESANATMNGTTFATTGFWAWSRLRPVVRVQDGTPKAESDSMATISTTTSEGVRLMAESASSRDGAVITDVPLQFQGRDKFGVELKREMRTSFVQLEDRASWMERISSRSKKRSIIDAKFEKMIIDGGEVTHMLLQMKGRSISVQIRSEYLRKSLLHIDFSEGNWRFGIEGEYLVTVVQLLD